MVLYVLYMYWVCTIRTLYCILQPRRSRRAHQRNHHGIILSFHLETDATDPPFWIYSLEPPEAWFLIVNDWDPLALSG